VVKISFFLACACLLFPCLLMAAEENPYALQEGDIVFSSSSQGQGKAIMDATGSIYTHCGIVQLMDGQPVVLEAVQPVRLTPLATFISHSDPGTFTAKRLKAALSPEYYQNAKAWAISQVGKNYDDQFRWDDQRMYCSELVWKIYQKAGVQLCDLKKFADYSLEQPEVRKVIEQRYGSISNVPTDENVVAPGDLAASPLLTEAPRR